MIKAQCCKGATRNVSIRYRDMYEMCSTFKSQNKYVSRRQRDMWLEGVLTW